MGWWSSRTPASRRSAAAPTLRPRPWPGYSTVQYSTVQHSTVQYLAGAILPAVRVWQLRVSWRQVQNWQSVLQPSEFKLELQTIIYDL